MYFFLFPTHSPTSVLYNPSFFMPLGPLLPHARFVHPLWPVLFPAQWENFCLALSPCEQWGNRGEPICPSTRGLKPHFYFGKSCSGVTVLHPETRIAVHRAGGMHAAPFMLSCPFSPWSDAAVPWPSVRCGPATQNPWLLLSRIHAVCAGAWRSCVYC